MGQGGDRVGTLRFVGMCLALLLYILTPFGVIGVIFLVLLLTQAH
jgi:hypothetical protein